jgi:hypothetical protein
MTNRHGNDSVLLPADQNIPCGRAVNRRTDVAGIIGNSRFAAAIASMESSPADMKKAGILRSRPLFMAASGAEAPLQY